MNNHPLPNLFSVLSETEQARVSKALSHETVPENTILFEQEISRADKFYILLTGRGEYGFKTLSTVLLKGDLLPGDDFGALAIMFNGGVAIRTLEIVEDASLAVLDPDFFLGLCKNNPAFQDHFCREFGRNMQSPSFAAIIARRIRDREFNLPFFNRPIGSVFKPNLSTCDRSTPILEAAEKMSRNNAGAILIKGEGRTVEGIVTDADLKNKVVAARRNLSDPVSEIMSVPLISIGADRQVFEAFLAMARHDKRHLAVLGQSGDVTGVISRKDLISAQTESTYLLIKTILSARSPAEFENIHDRLVHMLLDPIRNGAHPEYLTRLISACSDAVIERIIHLSLETAGPPPCRFVFLTMGSEGREEQTLISDQDNALVYEDTPSPETDRDYFNHLADLICDRLHTAGYQYCNGGNMAKNPAWCRPLSQWKKYFDTWIRASSPEDLLHSSIFFDFRGTWGHMALAEDLKRHLQQAIRRWPGFLRHLTENALYYKPPINLFGRFVVETRGERKDVLDLKAAMLPIVDFARIYALRNDISQTNTQARLFRLYTRHALTAKEHMDISRAYDYLMQLRFLRQITTLMDEKTEPDNYINPKNFSSIDRMLLKEIFRLTARLQNKLGLDFTGGM